MRISTIKYLAIGGILCFLLSPLYAGEKDVLDNALHWETIAEPKAFRNHLFSSYDRQGGNYDLGYYYGTDDNDWDILADLEGAGCMLRFWTTRHPCSNDWRIRIYVDNLDEPVLEAPYIDFFGDIPPFIPPLADSSRGAWISYLPILFGEHFRMTLGPPELNIEIYYTINIIEFDDNAGVTSFTMPPSSEYQQKLDSLSLMLQTAHQPPWTPSDSLRCDTTLTIAPDSTAEVVNISGVGTIFRFEIESSPMTWELARALNLSIYYDGETIPRIEAPIGDLIAMGFSTRTINAIGFSLLDDQIGFYFPMPFERGARILLTNTSTSAAPVRAAISWTPTEIYSTRLCGAAQIEDDLVFHQPLMLMDVDGPGHLIACMLTQEAVAGGDAGRLLEGDDLVWIDWEEQPSWIGTGTEDYFHGGYYYENTVLSRAYYGNTYFRRWSPGRHAAYRIHATDYIAFQNHLTFGFEHGGFNERPGTYRSVCLFYGQLKEWFFEDSNGDGMLYEGEPFHIWGRLLPPDTSVEVSLNDVVLIDLPERTTSLGAYEGVGICPSLPNGEYSLLASYEGQIDTIEVHVSVESVLSLSVTNLRRDTVLFPYDTLELSAYPVSSLEGAVAYCNGLLMDWLDETLTLDSLFVLRGRVQMPSLEDGPIEVELHTGSGNVLKTLNLGRQIRWEVEQSIPPISYRPAYFAFQQYALGGSLGVKLNASGPGDSIIFEIPPIPPGRFAVHLFLSNGPSRGITDVLWDDTVRISGIDCYNREYIRSDSIPLDTITSNGLSHQLMFRVVGKNPSAWGYLAAADQLVYTGLSHEPSATPKPDTPLLPAESFLDPGYPNPFNSVSVIRYGISRPEHVRLIIYNVLGQRVATLIDKRQDAGVHRIIFDAAHLASGLYFCQLQAGAFRRAQKLLLLK